MTAKKSMAIFRYPELPKETNPDWMEENDPELKHYKFLASNVDWEEWVGGSAEILSAYNTQREKIEELRTILKQWLEFSSDVQPGCAAGAELLIDLKLKTAVFLDPNF